jgi:hypothetical protein
VPMGRPRWGGCSWHIIMARSCTDEPTYLRAFGAFLARSRR